jgi:hypothetical protein
MEGKSASIPQRCPGSGEGVLVQRRKQERGSGDARCVRCRLTVGSASCTGQSSPQRVEKRFCVSLSLSLLNAYKSYGNICN